MQTSECADPNAECTGLKCICKDGYYDNDGIADNNAGTCEESKFDINPFFFLLEFPALNNWTNPCRIKGCWVMSSIFFNFIQTLTIQSVVCETSKG